MTQNYVGSCQCGNVQVKCTAAPVVHLCCHCGDCRQATGAPASNIAFFLKKSVELSGEVSSDHFSAVSGNDTMREKCVNCGTMMFDKSAGFSALIGVFSAQIETPNLDAPSLHVWTSSKLSNVEIPSSVNTFEKGLPAP